MSKVIREVGLSSSCSTNWRNGVLPNAKTVEKIAARLGLTAGYLIDGDAYSLDMVRESGRVGEPQNIPYHSSDSEKNPIAAREIGRLQGRIQELERRIGELEKENKELERKAAEYRDIIENRDNRLLNEVKKIADQMEKMSKQLDLNKK